MMKLRIFINFVIAILLIAALVVINASAQEGDSVETTPTRGKVVPMGSATAISHLGM